MDTINFIDIVSLVSTICCYNIAQLITRLHLTTMYMWPIVTDRTVWSVCLSVGRSVRILSAAKTTEQIEMPFEVWPRVGPRNNVLDGVQIPRANGQFWGRNVTCMTNGWLKEQDHNSFALESQLCRNTWPSAFQLQFWPISTKFGMATQFGHLERSDR